LGWLGWGHGKQLRDPRKPGNPEKPVLQPSLRAKRSNPRFFAPEDGLLRRKRSSQ
jgi:hypothetical protein